ncbi:MAG: UDP-N-acetylmuramoyl-L-alanine--D-glutamate ligase [Nautilia sp.]|nr:MAG: UDP-N-acetylmuramoyl-L-alanine--D-glutamate ligase [Nautilia sp.]
MKKSLFGYGGTIKAIAESGNWEIYDDRFKEISFDKYGNKLLPSNLFDETKSKLEITTPGIPPQNLLIKKAKNLISDYDYFYNEFPFSIWVSGTNGKTTTTQMIEYLLEDSEAGGNIGLPIAKMNRNRKFWILETSSFTLHYTKIAKPNIYILLPITSDHISWHGSFEEYEKDKLSVLNRMDERDIAIIPKKYESYPTSAFKITYENSNDLIDYFGFKETHFEEPFRLDEILAKAVYKILFFKEKSLKEFKIDAHKIEEFKDNKNRIWVDDSKATNIDATIQALKKYKNYKIHLIVGGDSKKQNLIPLFEEISTYNINLYLIGKDTPIFEKYAKKYNIDYFVCNKLTEAVNLIDKNFNDGIALLSPASASLDQFSSYKERGEKFKNLVLNLS